MKRAPGMADDGELVAKWPIESVRYQSYLQLTVRTSA
jgi:hypothetical protein